MTTAARQLATKVAGSRAAAPVDAGRALSIRNVSRAYGERGAAVLALDRIDLDVGPGEFVCLVGASGCGKTTLLNLVSGLDRPTAGVVETGGARTALMFQEAALFPWLTVAGNVELALRLNGVAKAERRRRAAELLETVHLGGQARRRPHELSGGMRQRVALARALAQDAQLLLMDEPFGAVDAITRDLLHDELEAIWQARDITVLFVTHNVREAVRLGDRIVLLTSRPGTVAATFDVNLPRPRRLEAPEVSELAGRVIGRLRQEVGRHGH